MGHRNRNAKTDVTHSHPLTLPHDIHSSTIPSKTGLERSDEEAQTNGRGSVIMRQLLEIILDACFSIFLYCI